MGMIWISIPNAGVDVSIWDTYLCTRENKRTRFEGKEDEGRSQVPSRLTEKGSSPREEVLA